MTPPELSALSGERAARSRPRPARRAVAAVLLGLVGAVLLLVGGAGDEPAPSTAPAPNPGIFETTERYAVTGAGDLDPAPSPEAAELWDLFRRIVTPETAARDVVAYEVGDDAASDYYAWVAREEADPERWVLAVNTGHAEDRSGFLVTLVHEYGHLLTLGPDQLDETWPCATLEVLGRCALPDADILAFDELFWSAYGEAAPGPDYTDEEAALAFYRAHEEDFVTDYAATNVSEDVAETFAAFVLEDEPDPAAVSVPADKLRFFWDRERYVDIRERIRTDLEL